MPLTLGSLLRRLDKAGPNERFIYLITSTDGPCRFGVYNLLNQIVLDRLGWRDRLRIWSPKSSGYFDGTPVGTAILMFTAIAATDFLLQAKLDVRPVERVPGETDKLYDKFYRELLAILDTGARGDLSAPPSIWQVASRHLFGIRDLLQQAGIEFARLRGPAELPIVELTGEMYLRAVNFSNDFLIDKLEARGLRVHLSPKTEWINYCAYCRSAEPGRNRFADGFSDRVQSRIQKAAFAAIGPQLGWPSLPTSEESLGAAAPYMNKKLETEAILSIGTPLFEWRRGDIDGVVSVGPLECMPTKLAEAQFHHIAERDGLLSLTLSFNGDPIGTAALDNFAYEVKSRFRRRHESERRAQCTLRGA